MRDLLVPPIVWPPSVCRTAAQKHKLHGSASRHLARPQQSNAGPEKRFGLRIKGLAREESIL